MKKIILVIFSMLSCNTDSTYSYQKVLEDFSKQSYFLAFEVNISSKKQKVIIKNTDFKRYFDKLYNSSDSEYKAFAENIIYNHKLIELNTDKLSNFNFIKVDCKNIENENIQSLYNKYISKNNVLDSSDEKLNQCLIYLFFYNNIISKIDDESGYIIVERLSDNRKQTN